jgi:hypothetical protein
VRRTCRLGSLRLNLQPRYRKAEDGKPQPCPKAIQLDTGYFKWKALIRYEYQRPKRLSDMYVLRPYLNYVCLFSMLTLPRRRVRGKCSRPTRLPLYALSALLLLLHLPKPFRLGAVPDTASQSQPLALRLLRFEVVPERALAVSYSCGSCDSNQVVGTVCTNLLVAKSRHTQFYLILGGKIRMKFHTEIYKKAQAKRR